ncbi:tyrosine-protein phosphatase [Jeotgalicoccus sp. FSL K6-3177]|uniref:tyrosine-protein phosphatase n=1 Tax=Jeotgalicoccus sp. FSL K6-3177 TaxID=2921494 RepID=UPI0030FD9FD1
MIDIHNHLLINVDDGPKSEEETLDLLKQAVDEGITDIICTPHHHSGAYNTPADIVREKLTGVQNIIDKHQLPIKVHPGQEIRINDDLIDELRTGEALTLAGSKYILIEFSFTELREDVDEVFTALRELGLTPIIAHPERCRPLVKNEQILARLIEEGALAQVTAASVCGEFGSGLQENSLELIRKGLIQLVASDAHHAEYRPFMSKEAFEIIENELGESYVEKMKQTAADVLHNQ